MTIPPKYRESCILKLVKTIIFERITNMSMIRAYKRSMARHKMDLEGMRKVNKRGRGKANNSYFANHWREYLPSNR